MSSIKRFISQIFMSCPYTMAGKKCVNAVTGKKEERKVSSCKAEEYKAGIKLGRNIALIGFFCPIFWGSVIMGAPASFQSYSFRYHNCPWCSDSTPELCKIQKGLVGGSQILFIKTQN